MSGTPYRFRNHCLDGTCSVSLALFDSAGIAVERGYSTPSSVICASWRGKEMKDKQLQMPNIMLTRAGWMDVWCTAHSIKVRHNIFAKPCSAIAALVHSLARFLSYYHLSLASFSGTLIYLRKFRRLPPSPSPLFLYATAMQRRSWSWPGTSHAYKSTP